MGSSPSTHDPNQTKTKPSTYGPNRTYTAVPSATSVRTLTDILKEYQNGRNTLSMEDVRALQSFIKKNSQYAQEANIHSMLGVADLRQRLAALQQERKDVLNKISEIAGARLKSNNPAIADLSDQNRPSKLAEKFSELYDNEWTDATEELKGGLEYKEISEEDVEIIVIKLFYEITKDIYKRCIETSEKQFEKVRMAVQCLDENSEVHQKMTVELERKCREFIRTHGEVTLSQIIEKLPGEVLRKIENSEANELKITCDKLKSCNRVMDFVKSCTRLCWYMSIQEPPVHMVTNVDAKSLYMFRAYTRSGDVIDYVVWPSLLLKEDGPLLYKGVAQLKRTIATTRNNKNCAIVDKSGGDKASPNESSDQQDEMYENVKFPEQNKNEVGNGMSDKSKTWKEEGSEKHRGNFVTTIPVGNVKNEYV